MMTLLDFQCVSRLPERNRPLLAVLASIGIALMLAPGGSVIAQETTGPADGKSKAGPGKAINHMIDQLEVRNLGGAPQWVLYRGDDRSNPVVLFVHGGPGYPTMWFSRGLDGEFIKHFVVVHWDQRGAGKSQSPDLATETITLNQIVDDGLELTRHLKQKFDTERIILVGHSWGTMVAANMVRKSPEDFLAFVSVGTCAAWKRGEELRYRELQRIARERHDDEAIRQLQALGSPPYRNAEQVQRFGMLVHSLQGYSGASRKLSEQQLAEALGSNQEYDEQELEVAVTAIQENLNLLGEFCNRYVLMNAVPRLDVPVVFVQGEHDTNTPTVIAKEYFDVLEAPRGKRWVVFKGCAHMAMYEDRQQFLQILKSTLEQHP